MTLEEAIKTPLIEQVGMTLKRIMDELRKMMEDLGKAILKASRKVYDFPGVVEFCLMIKKKAARKAKYYRRMNFYKQHRKQREH